MAFIEYKPIKGGLMPKSAKLTKTHLILSPNLHKKLGNNKAIVAYDSDDEVLKLTPTESGGLKVTEGKIQSKGFVSFFGIDKKGTFNAEWDDKQGAIFINLKAAK
jgi:hypothetical protein